MANEVTYVQCVTKSTFDPGTLGGSYVALNGTGFSDSVKIWKLYNGSLTVSIDISLDGVTDHDFIPPMGTLIVDFQAGHGITGSVNTGTLNLRKGQILYGKTASHPTFLQIVGYR